MKQEDVPAPTVRRLSLYLRELEGFLSRSQVTVSSKRLGEVLGLTDAQVRKDLAHFGQFGRPGVGYHVESLIQRIRQILGTDKTWNVALVGAGNLGRALAAYRGFAKKGFRIVAAFDNDPAKIGAPLSPHDRGLTVQRTEELPEAVQRLGIQLGILCVPAPAAQQVADDMIRAGIRGIVNFAPVSLNVPAGVAVAGVDLAVQLEQLSFQLSAAGIRPDRAREA